MATADALDADDIDDDLLDKYLNAELIFDVGTGNLRCGTFHRYWCSIQAGRHAALDGPVLGKVSHRACRLPGLVLVGAWAADITLAVALGCHRVPRRTGCAGTSLALNGHKLACSSERRATRQ